MTQIKRNKHKEIAMKETNTETSIVDQLDAIADDIKALANVGKQLDKSNLNRRAVNLLLKDLTGVSMANIDKILKGLPELLQFVRK